MPKTADLFRAGNAHQADRQFAAALTFYDQAIALDPDLVAAHSQRGLTLMALGRKAEALASGARATVIAPQSADAWVTLGMIFGGLSQAELALKAYRKAKRLSPDRPDLPGRILQQQMLCCDWDGVDPLVRDIAARLEAGEDAVHPFYWQAISSSPRSLLLAGQNHQRALTAVATAAPHPPPVPGARIRIGYLSGELNLSPNGLVMAGVFDHHDRAAFDIIAFDNGRDDGTSLRRRIMRAFTRVIDVRAMSDAELANVIRAERIDIAVDLNGYFGSSRSAALRHRPAPVQVSYLGCPATSGAAHFDYAIADAVVVPDDEHCWHSEAIVHLPDSYYPTDRHREIAKRAFTRAECGLPEDGFVFCCFNHCHKILPGTFALWMRILRATEGSVLWLLDANPTATANLRAAAARHGINPARLVFAPRLPPDEHLARHTCADLILDTLPYNGHTTTTDSLWARLPVLTLAGSTWPGRVSASVLGALSLPELIAATPDEYTQRAVELATRPQALAAVNQRLEANRLTAPLFDTAFFTRHLEAAYRMMHHRRCNGHLPEPFAIDRY